MDHILGEHGASLWEHKILPLRQQAATRMGWLRKRLDTILPEIMRREGFDAWIVSGREYNEDPVLMTLLPPTTSISARRRTILLFFLKPDGSVERLSLSRTGSGHDELYQGVWDQFKEEQWECVARLVRERDPKCIGINVSKTFAFGDGLTHAEHGELMRALGDDLATRTRGAERLAVGWLERRSKDELDAYPGIVQMVHGIVAEAFSAAVVHPGVTTSLDVTWWIRQRMEAQGLPAWFHPSVSAQRRGKQDLGPGEVIRPGDVLHCDVGFHYLGLATDCQQLAYVLRPGENDAPAGLKAALKAGNDLQDILAAEMQLGRTGNQILAESLAKMKAAGIDGSIYTHPLGNHGHGAGPTIGLFDHQEGVPGRGDYELFADTCHAMELCAKKPVPEWGGQVVTAALEEDIWFDGERVRFLDGRQTAFHLIR
ncbi:MAG: M24 family metallopeptidase [Bacillota bacterium]